MRSLLDPNARASLTRRLESLRPDTPARWGSFDAPGMLSHLIQSLRVTVGDAEMPPEPTPLLVRRGPLRYLLIHTLPFPRGLATSPVLLERPPLAPDRRGADEWAAECGRFTELLDRIGSRPADGPWPTHAAFGAMSGREWGVLQYRHADHHFRQFGI